MVSDSMPKFVVDLYKARANPAFGHFLSILNLEYGIRLDTSELKSILLNAGISHPLASNRRINKPRRRPYSSFSVDETWVGSFLLRLLTHVLNVCSLFS